MRCALNVPTTITYDPKLCPQRMRGALHTRFALSLRHETPSRDCLSRRSIYPAIGGLPKILVRFVFCNRIRAMEDLKHCRQVDILQKADTPEGSLRGLYTGLLFAPPSTLAACLR